MKLFLVGNRVEIEGVADLTRFGQSIDVDDSLGKELLTKGSLISEADFKAIGFTEEELSFYAESWRHGYIDDRGNWIYEAPASFREKKARALAAAQGAPTAPAVSLTSNPSLQE